MKIRPQCKIHGVALVCFCPACRGSARSSRKTRASLRNGKLGGRPPLKGSLMETETGDVEIRKVDAKENRARAGKRQRGIFEKRPDSRIWWIRFTDALGKYRREKIATFSAARKLLGNRRGEAVEGKKLPAFRQRAVSITELADDAIEYVKNAYGGPADDLAHIKRLKEHFTGDAEAIAPKGIERVLNTLSAPTAAYGS
jgi:hypothetical protein